MLKRDISSLLSNSLGPNALVDDKTALNYMALAYAICGFKTDEGIKPIGVSTACRAFKLYDNAKKDEYILKGQEKKVKSTNIKTGEVKIFDSIKNCAKELKKSESYISSLIRRNKASTDGWKVELISLG